MGLQKGSNTKIPKKAISKYENLVFKFLSVEEYITYFDVIYMHIR